MKLPQPITFELQDWHREMIDKQAEGIYNNPASARGRGYKQIWHSCFNGSVLEFALEAQGGKLNLKEKNSADVSSYGVDVYWEGLNFEVKRCRITSGTKWFSFTYDQMKTFYNTMERDPKLVDFVLAGDYNMVDESNVSVTWLLMAPARTFKRNVRKSNFKDKYGNDTYYYNHHFESNSIWLKEESLYV